ncbi:glycoside hydrolase family 3 C-terminal domain-containing protein [Erythrobacter sp. SD-21]|uniref:glycoside hydrolase family 3 C-terminal domain-containing protein n=1 Tax=Erythrobacter sp. SD-21 TaxID=161528 RepID=UPI000153F697|nr:glycoside hydrolase family 3 C-terminal domain-containing protein [Erythrobacter sp. SD-21]EDL49365.1 glycoside hydrolase, family 3-like protein [Erythrobacter sp. SD-21]
MSAPATSTECERVVADLLALMTPREKAGQLAMRAHPDADGRDEVERFMSDLCAGHVGTVTGVPSREQADHLQALAREDTRLGIPLLIPAETGTGIDTIFPSPLAMAACWDMDLIESAEGVVAQEVSSLGANWAFSPEIALTGSGAVAGEPCCGMHIHLAAQIAAARIRGLQGGGARRSPSVLSCLELSGMGDATATGGSACREVKAICALELAQAAIAGGSVGAIAFDGMSGETRRKVEQAFRVLKGPGGFDGILLSEWDALALELTGAETAGRRAGVPFDALVAALETSDDIAHRVDDLVARVLRAKFRLGLLRSAFSKDGQGHGHALPTPVHNREIALKLASRSAVLLRNSPALLPLGIDSGDILVVGFAASDRAGPLDGCAGIAASVLDGLEQLGIPHRYVPGLALRGSDKAVSNMIAADRMAIGMACEAAKRAGTVVLVLAAPENGQLGEADEALLGALASANERLVVVNIGAVPLDPKVCGKPLPTVLHAGKLGTMAGHAIAEILTGETAPSGKLPLALPATDGTAGLPFGHGLTYADFALTDLAIELGRERIYASALLRNAGEVDGTETVQLFLERTDDEATGSTGQPMRLVDFQRVRLRPGGAETLTFELGRQELGRYRIDGSFHVEPGDLVLSMGLSSARAMRASLQLTPDLARSIASSERRFGTVPILPLASRSA